MLPSPDRRAPWFGTPALGAVSLLFGLGVAQGQEAAAFAAEALTLHPAGMSPFVRLAVTEAHRRLTDARCRAVFADFEDAAGRRLQERLDELGLTSSAYLGRIWFVDAGFAGPCFHGDVFAFTTPGSPVVHVCGDRFARGIQRRGIGFLATVIIHEELHTLGLGENPPTSVEITRRVESRCGP